MRKKNNHKKILQAFSTAEVLFSMFILTVGIVALVLLMSRSVGNSLVSRDIIIAAELAQEGVELVRNVRDNNFASGGDGFASFNGTRRYCRIDYNDASSSLDCGNASDRFLSNPSRYYLQHQGGFYGHFTSTRERFSRGIYVDYNTPGPGNKNALVRSFVWWGSYSGPANNGDSAGCTALNSCVFTEVYLTSWK